MTNKPSDNAIESVLELLAEHDLKLQSNNVAENVGMSLGYARQALKWAEKRDLVTVDDEGKRPFYEITDLGRRYLDNDLDDEDMIPDDL